MGSGAALFLRSRLWLGSWEMPHPNNVGMPLFIRPRPMMQSRRWRAEGMVMDREYPEHLDDIDYLRGTVFSGPHPILEDRDVRKLESMAGQPELTGRGWEFLGRVLERARRFDAAVGMGAPGPGRHPVGITGMGSGRPRGRGSGCDGGVVVPFPTARKSMIRCRTKTGRPS